MREPLLLSPRAGPARSPTTLPRWSVLDPRRTAEVGELRGGGPSSRFARAPAGCVWTTHPRRVSLALIPGAEWHNAMKAPPCMRWRGLHLTFAMRAARFLGRLSPPGHSPKLTTIEAPVTRRSASNSRPSEISPAVPISPRWPSVSVTWVFLLPPSECRKGFDQRFQDFRSLHSSIHRTRMVIPRPDELLHRLSTLTRSRGHAATGGR